MLCFSLGSRLRGNDGGGRGKDGMTGEGMTEGLRGNDGGLARE